MQNQLYYNRPLSSLENFDYTGRIQCGRTPRAFLPWRHPNLLPADIDVGIHRVGANRAMNLSRRRFLECGFHLPHLTTSDAFNLARVVPNIRKNCVKDGTPNFFQLDVTVPVGHDETL